MGRPRKYPETEVLIAIDSGVVVYDGNTEQIFKGISRAHRGHPIVKAAPDLWKPIEVHYRVEQMTAAPGELRGE